MSDWDDYEIGRNADKNSFLKQANNTSKQFTRVVHTQ